MKKRLLRFAALILIGGALRAESSDLSDSYYHYTLARMHASQREYSEAFAEYEKAIALDPKSLSLRMQFAAALHEGGQIRRAVEECRKAIELYPDEPAPHFLLGRIYFAYRDSGQGNMLDKSLAEFERVVELNPRHVQALDSLGRLYYVKAEYGKAVAVFARLNELSPAYTPAYYLGASAQVRLGQTKRAIEILEQSLRYQPGDFDNLKLLGNLYNQEHKYRKAVEVLRRASEMREETEALLELGKALKGDRKYSEAVEVFTEVLKSNPDDLEAGFELAQILGFMGRRQEAITRFEALLQSKESEQNIPIIQTQLALLYQETRQYDKAADILREVNQTAGDNFRLKLQLAYVLRDAGKLSEALAYATELARQYPHQAYVLVAQAQLLAATGELEKAVALLADNVHRQEEFESLYLAASQIYLDQKKFREAERIIKEGLARKADSEPMRFQLAAVYERQGELARAEADFKEILAANAEHADVLNYLGYMFAERGIRLQEALEYIKRAVEIDPYNGAYLDSLGWAYFKLNQLDLAEANLKQAAQLRDDDPTILEHLGDLYRRLGRYDEAEESYRKSASFSKEAAEQKKVQEKLRNLKKLLSQRRQ